MLQERSRPPVSVHRAQFPNPLQEAYETTAKPQIRVFLGRSFFMPPFALSKTGTSDLSFLGFAGSCLPGPSLGMPLAPFFLLIFHPPPESYPLLYSFASILCSTGHRDAIIFFSIIVPHTLNTNQPTYPPSQIFFCNREKLIWADALLYY